MHTLTIRFLLLLVLSALPAALAQDSKPGDPFVKGKAPAKAAAGPAPVNPSDDPPPAGPFESEPFPTNMVFTFETYTLTQEDLDAIHEDTPGNPAFHERVRQLVSDGKAALENLMALPTRNGQRATTESMDEVIYPTEFDPPVPGRDFGFPTAFEMRPTGERVELDPVLSEDEKMVDINFAPEFCRLLGFVLHKADDKTSGQLQPLFESRKVTTSIACQMNVPTYVGTCSKAHQSGRAGADGDDAVALMFVTVRLSGPKEAMPPAGPPNSGAENLRMVYRFYSLPRATARDLLVTAPDADKLHALLLALPPAERKLERLLTVQTRSGQRATLEEIVEDIYGTEVETPKPPRVEKDNETAAPARPIAGQKGSAAPPDESAPFVSGAPLVPANFNAFEMRPLGWRIEVDPVLHSNGRVADLNLAPEHVEYRGHLEGHPMLARYPQQPLYATQKITTAVSAIIGRQCFLGTMSVPRETGVNGRQDDGRTWFAFVKVTVE